MRAIEFYELKMIKNSIKIKYLIRMESQLVFIGLYWRLVFQIWKYMWLCLELF
jgi:hypothetical protein